MTKGFVISLRTLQAAVLLSMLVGGLNTLLYPLEAQAAPKAQAKQEAAAVKAPFNINTAGAEELQSVRGIGPALADRILQYRKEHGRFERLEDLVSVRGIGEAKFEKIRSQISI